MQVQVGTMVATKSKQCVLLKTIPVRIMAENGNSLTTLGMLDSGASATFVTRPVAQKLGVQGTPEVTSVNTALAKGQDQNVTVYGCSISPFGAAEPKIPVRKAHIVNDMNIDDQYRPNTLDISEWSHLEKSDLSTGVEEDSVRQYWV